MSENMKQFRISMSKTIGRNRSLNARLNLENTHSFRDKNSHIATQLDKFVQIDAQTYFHQRDVNQWLLRYKDSTNPDYLYYPSEKVKCLKLKKIFEKFDSDNSNTLELNEFFEMFTQSYLGILRGSQSREFLYQKHSFVA